MFSVAGPAVRDLSATALEQRIASFGAGWYTRIPNTTKPRQMSRRKMTLRKTEPERKKQNLAKSRENSRFTLSTR